MADMKTVRRESRGGIAGWLDEETSRWLPIMAGAEGDGDGDGDGGDGADAATDDAASSEGSESDGGGDGRQRAAKSAEDYRLELRKTDRRAKAIAKENDELKAKLKEIEDQNKSEQERALERARREAAQKAAGETTKAFRSRILKAEIRAYARDFADPDDAVALLDVDEEDLFDNDGEVRNDALKAALADLLERKPHLKAGRADENQAAGSADAGKGASSDNRPTDMNSLLRRARGR